tara:strand:- start:499 stop:2388 length:1890 start_codon:yes stop_codon:yes gene_type:complete
MSVEARLDDGTILSFPDGTERSVVDRAVKELVSSRQKKYDYGGDRGATDPFMPFRREILREEETNPTGNVSLDKMGRMQQELETTDAEYGDYEFGMEYMPVARGVQQVGGFLKDIFLGDDQERADVGRKIDSAVRSIPDMLSGQIEAFGSDTGSVYDPETRMLTEADPLLLAGLGAPAAAKTAISTGVRLADSTADIAKIPVVKADETLKAISSRFRDYESPAKLRAESEMREGGIPATRNTTAGYRMQETVDPDNTLPVVYEGERSRPDYNEEGRTFKAVKDPIQKAAMNQGFDKGLIAMIREGSSVDRKNMLASLKIMEESTNNTRFRMTARTTDVAGDSVLKRYNAVSKENKKAGAGIDQFAKSNMQNTFVDFTDPVDSFRSSLENMGVRFNNENALDFSSSDIEGIASTEAFLNRIVKRMGSPRRMSAYDVHIFKRYLDTQMSYGKAMEGLEGGAERAVATLRRDLDGVLDNQYPEYDRLNSTYSESIGALKDFKKYIGPSIQIEGKGANSAIGTALRAVGSNRVSRINLLNALNDLDVLSAKYNQRFNDDVLTQAQFSMELDKIFGTKADTAFAAQSAVDAASRVPLSVSGVAMEGVRRGADKVMGRNEAKQFRAMESLLKSFD